MTRKKTTGLKKCPKCKTQKKITGFIACNIGNESRAGRTGIRLEVCADCAESIKAEKEKKNTKKCVKCGDKKHASQFYLNRQGYQGYCKMCREKAVADGESPYPALKRSQGK